MEHLLLGRVVERSQSDEAADVLSILLENHVVPEEGVLLLLLSFGRLVCVTCQSTCKAVVHNERPLVLRSGNAASVCQPGWRWSCFHRNLCSLPATQKLLYNTESCSADKKLNVFLSGKD